MITLADKITLSRILLTPLFLYLLGKELFPFNLALGLYLLASDALDGYIARKSGKSTPLGSFLDPLADKLLLLPSFYILTLLGKIPSFFFPIVLIRDLIIFIGWAILMKSVKGFVTTPLWTGKIAIISQATLIFLILINLPAKFVLLFVYLTTGITIISIFDYINAAFQRLKKVKE